MKISKKKIKEMTDKEKLNYIVNLLDKHNKIEMFTDGSDTYGISFTREYEEIEEEIYNFLKIIR